MLTKRENAIETIRGGRPDRLVNQYEYLALMVGGYPGKSPVLKRGETAKNEWGVTYSWPEDSPAKMPICDSGHVVVKDIENWRSYVKAPSLDWKREDWQPYIDAAGKVDRAFSSNVTICWRLPTVSWPCSKNPRSCTR